MVHDGITAYLGKIINNLSFLFYFRLDGHFSAPDELAVLPAYMLLRFGRTTLLWQVDMQESVVADYEYTLVNPLMCSWCA
jgi:hypothetical protein